MDLVMSAAGSLVPRNLTAQVEEALVDTRIVLVQGARQVGKSTLLREVVNRHNGRVITWTIS